MKKFLKSPAQKNDPFSSCTSESHPLFVSQSLAQCGMITFCHHPPIVQADWKDDRGVTCNQDDFRDRKLICDRIYSSHLCHGRIQGSGLLTQFKCVLWCCQTCRHAPNLKHPHFRICASLLWFPFSKHCSPCQALWFWWYWPSNDCYYTIWPSLISISSYRMENVWKKLNVANIHKASYSIFFHILENSLVVCSHVLKFHFRAKHIFYQRGH